jgi:hypothetical protein
MAHTVLDFLAAGGGMYSVVICSPKHLYRFALRIVIFRGVRC